MGGFIGSLLIFFLASFLVRRRRQRAALLDHQHAPNAYYSLNSAAPSMADRNSVQPPFAGGANMAHNASSETARRYFPMTSHPPTSIASSSSVIPYILQVPVEATAGPSDAQLVLDMGSGSPAGLIIPPKADGTARRVFQDAKDRQPTMPPPYTD